MNCTKIVHYLEISDCPGQGFLKAKGEYYLNLHEYTYLLTQFLQVHIDWVDRNLLIQNHGNKENPIE